MMNHPDIMSANGQVRFDNMLASAEQYRRVKRLQRDKTGLPFHVLSIVSDALIALGSRARVQSRSDAEAPALNE
jgi:hypothetical protein